MSGGYVVVVGDALLDRDLEGRVERLAPDAPVPVVEAPEERGPGGAALAGALAAATVSLPGRSTTRLLREVVSRGGG